MSLSNDPPMLSSTVDMLVLSHNQKLSEFDTNQIGCETGI